MKNVKERVFEVCHKPHIYMTFNMITGKAYIGQHKGDKAGHYLGSGVYLKNSIKTYGKNNFSKIVLEVEPEDIDKAETDYIALYETLKPNGYNINPVGEAKFQYGAEPWNKGKKATLEAIENQRQAQLRRPPTTDDAKANMRAAALGVKKSPESLLKRRVTRGRKVQQFCLETGELLREFDAASFAAEQFPDKNQDTAKRMIRKVCNMKMKSAYGYSWAYR